jgi:hypothetical protein
MERKKTLFLILLCVIFLKCDLGEKTRRGEVDFISEKEAIKIAQKYLKIKDLKMFDIAVESKIITEKSFNAYKKLKKGTKKICWIIHFIVRDAIGSSRTVYVDKKNGEVYGGFSSK